MSSTSSSECICGECLNYGTNFGRPGLRPQAPYYQNLGHPLIYYAQVQQNPNYRKRSRESRQENPNCFVKAFRWYTQELRPPQSKALPNERTNLKGFAAWLDKKYDEFVLDKRAEQNTLQIQPSRLSTLEITKSSTSVTCDKRFKKKFARVKSPWKKRRRSVNSPEAGDVLEKCNKSCEFIMKPKELSRQTSECCHQVSNNRSNISTITQTSKKTIIKYHSSDRIASEKQNNVPIEIIQFEGKTSDRDLKSDRSKLKNIRSDRIASEKQNNVPIEIIQFEGNTSDRDLKSDRSKPKNLRSNRNANEKQNNVPVEIIQFEGNTTDRELKSDKSKPAVYLNQEQIKKNKRDVLCQCSEEKISIADADVQCALPSDDKKARVRPKKELVEYSEVPPQVHDRDGSKPKKDGVSNAPYKIARSETNISCQCSEIVIDRKDVQSQFTRELSDAECGCSISNHSKSIARPSFTHYQTYPPMLLPPCVRYPKSYVPQQYPVIKDMKIEPRPEIPKKVLMTVASGGVQTSDHSICIDKKIYPLFMKIIRVDKLNEEIFHR